MLLPDELKDTDYVVKLVYLYLIGKDGASAMEVASSIGEDSLEVELALELLCSLCLAGLTNSEYYLI